MDSFAAKIYRRHLGTPFALQNQPQGPSRILQFASDRVQLLDDVRGRWSGSEDPAVFSPLIWRWNVWRRHLSTQMDEPQAQTASYEQPPDLSPPPAPTEARGADNREALSAVRATAIVPTTEVAVEPETHVTPPDLVAPPSPKAVRRNAARRDAKRRAPAKQDNPPIPPAPSEESAIVPNEVPESHATTPTVKASPTAGAPAAPTHQEMSPQQEPPAPVRLVSRQAPIVRKLDGPDSVPHIPPDEPHAPAQTSTSQPHELARTLAQPAAESPAPARRPPVLHKTRAVLEASGTGLQACALPAYAPANHPEDASTPTHQPDDPQPAMTHVHAAAIDPSHTTSTHRPESETVPMLDLPRRAPAESKTPRPARSSHSEAQPVLPRQSRNPLAEPVLRHAAIPTRSIHTASPQRPHALDAAPIPPRHADPSDFATPALPHHRIAPADLPAIQRAEATHAPEDHAQHANAAKPAPAAAAPDVDDIVDRALEKLSRIIEVERERRGVSPWH